MATTNVTKTLTDAGYIAVGLGVMGVQQAQRSGRELRAYLHKTGACVHTRTRNAQTKVTETSRSARDQAQAQVRTAADQAQAQVRTTVDTTVGKAAALRDEVTKRVEPAVGKVQSQLNDLPEKVVQAMEPVTARVREVGGAA